jgi:AraC-like DNA-binding protein
MIRIVYDHARASSSQRPPGRPAAEHRHDVYHVLLTRAGVGDCSFNGSWVDIPAGSILCISPGDTHAVGMERKGCRYTAINFEAFSLSDGTTLAISMKSLLENLVGSALQPRADWPITALGRHAAPLRSLAGRVYRSACESQTACAPALQEFLIALAGAAFEAAPEEEVSLDAEVEMVRRRIEDAYARAISLDDLAREVHLSRRSLTRRFRAACGTSPLAYQKELRIRAAEMMLRSTDLQVQQIALEVGFGDVYQFSKAFRRHTGRTPSEERRRRIGRPR